MPLKFIENYETSLNYELAKFDTERDWLKLGAFTTKWKLGKFCQFRLDSAYQVYSESDATAKFNDSEKDSFLINDTKHFKI